MSKSSIGMTSTDPTTYGYIRLSTWLQDAEKDKIQISAYAKARRLPEPVQFHEERVSGMVPWKDRRIGEILKDAKKGDVCIITDFSRVARDMSGAMECMKAFLDKEVFLHSIKENVVFDGSLSSNITSKIFAMLADIEREIMLNRMSEARAARQSKMSADFPHVIRGVSIGKSKIDKNKDEVIRRLVAGESKADVAKYCGSSVNNLNTWLHKRGLDKKIWQIIADRAASSSQVE